MKEVAFIFLGSGLGGITRYGLGKWINTLHSLSFPLATLLINMLACLILGFIVGLADHKHIISTQTRLFWVVGFCGGFSTFSTFSHETLSLLQSGNHGINIIYILASVLFCLGITYLGVYLGNKI